MSILCKSIVLLLPVILKSFTGSGVSTVFYIALGLCAAFLLFLRFRRRGKAPKSIDNAPMPAVHAETDGSISDEQTTSEPADGPVTADSDTQSGATSSDRKKSASQDNIIPLDPATIAKAEKYVIDNIGRNDLSVNEVSEYLGMSRGYFHTRLRHTIGQTPGEFIRHIRIKRGKEMLRNTDLDISEIAFMIGYQHPKFFRKYFKEEFGMLPSEYQSRLSRGEMIDDESGNVASTPESKQ